MPRPTNKLSRFWKDLKRRGVVQVMTVYTSVALVLIEVINNLIKYFDLPPNLGTFVIVILAVGFPLTLVLSWLYDLSGDGIERTKPIDEVPEEAAVKVTNTWKIATFVSFVVILGLVTFNILKGTSALRSGDIQSLAILPFDNYTGDDGLDYVAAGMHSSLIGDMGKLGALRVIGKTTSSAYRNTDKSAPDIAKELNVEALVEPTVTCYGDSVCIQIRVITFFPEEKQLWVGDFKEDKGQILNLYNKITKLIADEILVELSPGEKRLLSETRTIDKEAYDQYLKAHSYWDDGRRESLQKAMDNLNSAIAKDPDWAPLYSALAQTWVALALMGFEQPSIASAEIYKNLNKALELDPNLSEAHFLKALIAHVMEWDWEKSEKEFLRALAINPNDAQSRMLYAQLLCILQRTEEAKTQGQLAFNLDPLDIYMKIWYGSILPSFGQCKTSVALAEEINADDPGNYLANSVILVAAFLCNEYDKVIKAEKNLLPEFNIEEDEIKEMEMIFKRQGIVSAYEKIMKPLEKFAENNHISFMDMAIRYIMADQPDKAMDWVEKGYEQHDPQMTYIATKAYNLEPLFSNPRFIAILNKMNLPLPKTN